MIPLFIFIVVTLGISLYSQQEKLNQENEENDTLENNTDNYGHEDFTETDESEEYIEDKEDGDDDDDDTLYYNQEELEEMTDDELKEVLQSMEIEYDDESFTREAAIIAILENYDNND